MNQTDEGSHSLSFSGALWGAIRPPFIEADKNKEANAAVEGAEVTPQYTDADGPTESDARAELQKVIDAKGFTAAQAVLKEAGLERVTGQTSAQYAQLIEVARKHAAS